MDPVSAVPGGVRVALHVQPRAASTELAGRHGAAYKLRISAPPVDGAANDAVVVFLARLLGVARRDVRIVAGATSRQKMVRIAGVDTARVRAAFDPPE